MARVEAPAAAPERFIAVCWAIYSEDPGRAPKRVLHGGIGAAIESNADGADRVRLYGRPPVVFKNDPPLLDSTEAVHDYIYRVLASTMGVAL